MRLTSPLNLPAPGRRQWLYGDSSSWQPPVFLLNSRLDRFSAACFPSLPHGQISYHRHPFSRSYGVILPNSLTRVLPFAWVCSTHLPVSDCGTDAPVSTLRGFSGQCGSTTSALEARHRGSAQRADLPAHLNAYPLSTRYPRGTKLRAGLPFCVTSSLNESGTGMLTGCPSPTPDGLG